MSCLHSFKVWREREKRTFRSSSIDWGKNSRALCFCKISIQIQVFTDFFFFFLLEFSLMFFCFLIIGICCCFCWIEVITTAFLRKICSYWPGHYGRWWLSLVWFGWRFFQLIAILFLMSGKTKRRLIIAWKTAIIWQVMRQNEKQTKTPEKQVN